MPDILGEFIKGCWRNLSFFIQDGGGGCQLISLRQGKIKRTQEETQKAAESIAH
jgi:hypothetical protein